MSEASVPTTTARPLFRSPRRLLLAGLGVLCVALAVLGAVLPGLPTTVFLILASYLFTRSCPVLEEKLLRNRLFRPYLQYVHGDRPMPRRARVVSLVLMWSAIGLSLAALSAAGTLAPWLGTALVAAGAAGTFAILRWRRDVRA